MPRIFEKFVKDPKTRIKIISARQMYERKCPNNQR